MTDNAMSNLKAYVKYVRPHYAKKDVEEIFITRDGEAFLPGTIGKRISTWWKKATGREITSTQLRKVGSTETMDEDLETQKAVQAVMTHRRTTAEEHYQILKKTKQAVKGHAALSKKLHLADSMPTRFSDDNDEDLGTTTLQSPFKTGLTESQLEDIDVLFAETISTHAALSFNEVKTFMSESSNLAALVDNRDTVKRVYNRVKYLQKKNFEKGLENVEDCSNNDDTSSLWVRSTSSMVSGPTRRFSWASSDEKTIMKAFEKFESCPLRSSMLEMFTKDQSLNNVMERNTSQRCYEEVKNIFKKRKNK